MAKGYSDMLPGYALSLLALKISQEFIESRFQRNSRNAHPEFNPKMETAWRVGFEDEKSFMKRFKQLEDITPTTYRNAFHRGKIVKE